MKWQDRFAIAAHIEEEGVELFIVEAKDLQAAERWVLAALRKQVKEDGLGRRDCWIDASRKVEDRAVVRVHVEGGLVQGVYASSQGVSVEVVDEDAMKHEGVGMKARETRINKAAEGLFLVRD